MYVKMEVLTCFVYLIMAMLRFATINVEGLRDDNKRMGVFQSLQNMNLDVVALQETHCDSTEVEKWKKQWPGLSTWSIGRTNAAGVAFLFSKN